MRLQQIYLLPLLFIFSLSLIVRSPTSCSSTEYFNSTLLDCLSCPENSQQSSDGLSCSCKPRHKSVYDLSTGSFSCVLCESGSYTFGPDITKCYKSSSNVVEHNGLPACTLDNNIAYLRDDGLVDCRPCPYRQFAVARSTTGQCISCPHPKQQYLLINGEHTCTCNNDPDYQDLDGTDTCILKSDLEKLVDLIPDVYINYRQIEKIDGSSTTAKVRSPFFANYYKAAYAKCLLDLDNTACQLLANMCVMNMYNVDSTMCRVLSDLQGKLPAVKGEGYSDSGWRQGLPWLYYAETGDAIRLSTRFSLRISLDPNSQTTKNKLELWVAKYYANGTYIEMEPLQPSFFLCPKMSVEQVDHFRLFGANTRHECLFDLNEALNTRETIFYEMFAKDSSGKLIDIPVRITNLVACIFLLLY